MVDPSHNVADLPHLGFAALLLFGFCAGLAQSNVLLGQSGRGDDCFGVCYITERPGVIFKRCAVGHIAQNPYALGNRRVRAGQVG